MSKALERTLVVAIVLNCVVRFTALGHAPPAFFSDEARASAHAICLWETGKDATGVPMPAFSPASGNVITSYRGALYPASWTYPAALWSQIFGKSPAAFRSLAAFSSVLSIIFMYCLARLLVSAQVALLAAFMLAFVPMHFHLSRLAWENATVPFWLLAGLYGFFKGSRWSLVGSALCLDLAAMAYSAQRVQVLALLPALFWVRTKLTRLPTWSRGSEGIFLVSLVLFAIPLLNGISEGYVLRRYDHVSIFDPSWLATYAPGNALEGGALSGLAFWTAGFVALMMKLYSHLSPQFLFFSGDENVRHSIQFVGELGFLEAVVIVFALARLAGSQGARCRHLRALCWYGIFVGILPSALSKGGPHALRCFGALPFLVIWASIELLELMHQLKSARVGLPRWLLRPALVGSLLLFWGYFFHAYFERYPRIARSAFEAEVVEAASRVAETGDWKNFVTADPHEHRRLARAYFAMAMGNISCEEARSWVPGVDDAAAGD